MDKDKSEIILGIRKKVISSKHYILQLNLNHTRKGLILGDTIVSLFSII